MIRTKKLQLSLQVWRRQKIKRFRKRCKKLTYQPKNISIQGFSLKKIHYESVCLLNVSFEYFVVIVCRAPSIWLYFIWRRTNSSHCNHSECWGNLGNIYYFQTQVFADTYTQMFLGTLNRIYLIFDTSTTSPL